MNCNIACVTFEKPNEAIFSECQLNLSVIYRNKNCGMKGTSSHSFLYNANSLYVIYSLEFITQMRKEMLKWYWLRLYASS